MVFFCNITDTCQEYSRNCTGKAEMHLRNFRIILINFIAMNVIILKKKEFLTLFSDIEHFCNAKKKSKDFRVCNCFNPSSSNTSEKSIYFVPYVKFEIHCFIFQFASQELFSFI